jgi:phosphatidylethanolamine-binding protein (PEBP) family uncharacterized protein
MRRFSSSIVSLPSLGLAALLFAACSSGTEDTGTAGTSGGGHGGGSTGVAGSPGLGGSTGVAGSPGLGGSTGVAGSPGLGGSTGVAGSPGLGGSTGVAGSPGLGGSTGVAGSAGATAGKGGGTAGSGGSSSGAAGTSGGAFTLTSPDHADNAKFAKDFTCDMMNGTFGAGIIPELNWAGVPAGTKSFAMTFIDTTIGENSSMGQHWAIWNIPWNPSTGKVSTIPKGTKALSGDLATAKQNGNYLAPCAQSLKNNMDDQYEFTIYALTTETLAITGTSVANALTALKAINPPPPTAKLHGHAGLKGK